MGFTGLDEACRGFAVAFRGDFSVAFRGFAVAVCILYLVLFGIACGTTLPMFTIEFPYMDPFPTNVAAEGGEAFWDGEEAFFGGDGTFFGGDMAFFGGDGSFFGGGMAFFGGAAAFFGGDAAFFGGDGAFFG